MSVRGPSRVPKAVLKAASTESSLVYICKSPWVVNIICFKLALGEKHADQRSFCGYVICL